MNAPGRAKLDSERKSLMGLGIIRSWKVDVRSIVESNFGRLCLMNSSLLSQDVAVCRRLLRRKGKTNQFVAVV